MRNGVKIDWKFVKCQPASLHEFINDFFSFEPPASSTHLSDLHVTLSHSDSFAALSDADSTATLPDADSMLCYQMMTLMLHHQMPTPSPCCQSLMILPCLLFVLQTLTLMEILCHNLIYQTTPVKSPLMTAYHKVP